MGLGVDFLAAVLERVGAAVMACDTNGKVVVANAAARAMLGESPPSSNPPLSRALRGGRLPGLEIANGVRIPAEPLFDGNQIKIGAIAYGAPAQHAEEEGTRKRLELLLESTGEGIYSLDMEGRCT